ncbi:MAG: PEP/pyruvate-binding domain-containing protein [Myxococcota bacterium]
MRAPVIRPRAGTVFIRQEGREPEKLTLEGFTQLSGILTGHAFVKTVYDRLENVVHFIDNNQYEFHVDYIAEMILGESLASVEANLDAFNQSLLAHDRRFCLGSVSLHERNNRQFFSLETVEVDPMELPLILEFYTTLREHLDPSIDLLFKPANHAQERALEGDKSKALPLVTNHEFFEMNEFMALNNGERKGRLRPFHSLDAYRVALPTLGWSDIVVMERVPDDIPRVAGIINAAHTTPLSHTNVLAHGWGIPNAIQLDIFSLIEREGLANEWVCYKVDSALEGVSLRKLTSPTEIPQDPAWTVHQVRLEAPEIDRTPICNLDQLRIGDAYRFGTKAANLGELHHILINNSNRLLGFYRIPRPPRPHLLGYLAKFLEVPADAQLDQEAWHKLQSLIHVPRGIAIPFSFHQEFLTQSSQIQQMIGKLKMALELNAREIGSLCLKLQRMIRAQRISDKLRDYIDAQIVRHLAGTQSFVIRSSSNAEDLENFSAAGLYESVNHVTTAENIFQSIKDVWASLLTPRSVRLRHSVKISLDESYMGVIIQEEIKPELGGVLVTTNPVERQGDFRNVFINASIHSATHVVEGSERPYQFLYNTVEGGGRTLSLGSAQENLSEHHTAMLQDLAFMGRLMQSHFAKDYTFSSPLDIEWHLR